MSRELLELQLLRGEVIIHLNAVFAIGNSGGLDCDENDSSGVIDELVLVFWCTLL